MPDSGHAIWHDFGDVLQNSMRTRTQAIDASSYNSGLARDTLHLAMRKATNLESTKSNQLKTSALIA